MVEFALRDVAEGLMMYVGAEIQGGFEAREFQLS